MDDIEEYQYFILNNLQTRMDKCTNEQFWVVTTILAMNAIFFSTDNLKNVQVFKGFLILALLLIISGYGIWFVIKRHNSYYFYRGEFSKILKASEKFLKIEESSILSKKPIKYSANTLSGVVFYVIFIIFATSISIISILTTIIPLVCKCNCS